MKTALLVLFSGLLLACDEPPATSSSASAAPAAKTSTPPKPTSAPTASATTEASPGTPLLPGTALKDTLKDVDTIMALGKATSPMGVMASDKKDIAAIMAAIGTDQLLKKPFESKCITPTKLAFQDKAKKGLGVLGFCADDDKFALGRFDGTGAQMAAVDVKDPVAFKAALKKIGAIK